MSDTPQVSMSTAALRLRSRLSKVCVAITGESAARMQENSTALLREFPFQELRLDYLPDPLAGVRELAGFVQANGAGVFLGTCRTEGSGGRFRGSARDELEVLCAAAEAGFALVDLSLESAEALGREAVDRLRALGAAVMVSFHDFEATGDLDAVFARVRAFRPDVCKIVPTAKGLNDSLALLRFLGEAEEHAPLLVVAMAMGEAGVLTRVLGPRAGSAFTFAAATAEEATAPGQMAARTLRDLYRAESIDAATRIFGVAGDPIRSSLSPLMLNTAFRRETVNAVYLPLLTNSAEDLFRAARELPLQGFSVTMPLKQTVIRFLARTDPLSTKIGAVNTVHRGPDGKFYGFNTDAAGIVGPLERRLSLRKARVLVLGAGGAARAAAFSCVDRGAEVSIVNRTHETAAALARQAGAKAIRREALAKAEFDVVINATPAGMPGNPLELPIQAEELRAGLVFDLVYNPIETPLLRLARQQGSQVISGVEMFVQQGARQFEIWTGKPAPSEEMLRVVLHALGQGALAGSAPRSPAVEQPEEEDAAEEASEKPPQRETAVVKKVAVKKKKSVAKRVR